MLERGVEGQSVLCLLYVLLLGSECINITLSSHTHTRGSAEVFRSIELSFLKKKKKKPFNVLKSLTFYFDFFLFLKNHLLTKSLIVATSYWPWVWKNFRQHIISCFLKCHCVFYLQGSQNTPNKQTKKPTSVSAANNQQGYNTTDALHQHQLKSVCSCGWSLA